MSSIYNRDSIENQLLFEAIKKNAKPDLIKGLIELGAKPNCYHIMETIQLGNIDVLKVLVSKTEDVKNRLKEQESSTHWHPYGDLLITAYDHGGLKMLKYIAELIEPDENTFKYKGRFDETVLHRAAQAGDMEAVKFLCEACPKSSFVDMKSWPVNETTSAASLAKQHGHYAVSKYLDDKHKELEEKEMRQTKEHQKIGKEREL